MKIIYALLSGVAMAALALSAQAADAYQPGQRLQAKQIQRLGQLPVYTVDKQQYRLLPQSAAGGRSLLLDAQGVVFSSQNEILITGATENDVQLGAGKGPVPVSVQSFAATGIVVLRYADFGSAVSALAWLQQQLPQASLHLAIEQAPLKPS
ncbi:hypothetical protein [Castellaniella sp.]|uniref:hypothetical protein n=1 Tax=Castellaniella sp. TaxID=1955812 RepID=UPI002AFDDE13|nr:hypothetical protein [Castellaniella sp.]